MGFDRQRKNSSRAGGGRMWRSRRGVLAVGALVLGLLAAALLFVLNPAPREFVVEIGPLDLPANASHHEAPQPPPRVLALPIDGWIQGLRVELVDAEGQPIPQRVLHHINLVLPEKRELFSPIMLRVGAAGPETAPISLPRVMGVRVHRGDTLLITAMFHNPTPTHYKNARLRVHIPYTASSTWLDPISIYPFYLDVMPPAGSHAFDLPPGRSAQSWEGSPAVAGRILAVGGHLHKYAESLRLEDVTTGEVLWEAEPTVNDAGEVVSMPTEYFATQLGLPLSPAHVYRLTATYDNPTGDSIPDGGMGALGGIMLPADDVAWPSVNRQDSTYQRDVLFTRGSAAPYATHGRGHHHGTMDDNESGTPAHHH